MTRLRPTSDAQRGAALNNIYCRRTKPRNAIHRRLCLVYREDWFADSRFIDILPDRHKNEVRYNVTAERAKRQAAFTVDHVVAGMSFGFWHSLLGASHAFVIWKDDSIHLSFPHLPRTLNRDFLYKRVERLRSFRNAVMHHYAIYDKSPTREFANIHELLTWLCPDTLWLMKELANPARVLQQRPPLTLPFGPPSAQQQRDQIDQPDAR